MTRVGWVVVWMGLLQGLGACTSTRVVGDQCPGPLDDKATVKGGVSSTDTTFGTSCAPCDGKVRYDAAGCPTFVTFAGCGGDICIGTQRISPLQPDASVMNAGDAGDTDGGDESDAGATEDGDGG